MGQITLTFDNGPTPAVTPKVLDVLDRHNVPATFFVVGNQLEMPRAREQAQMAHAAGHWIGNHTWSHDIPFGRRNDAGVAHREIGRTQDLIGDLAHPRRFFRPFGGGGLIGPHLLNRECQDYLEAGQFTCVLWNAIPGDWKDPVGWVSTALEQCAALDWALVVLHDLPTGAMDHLEPFIEAAKNRGDTFHQDFPPACVPMERGRVMKPMTQYVAA